jgi:protein SCO1
VTSDALAESPTRRRRWWPWLVGGAAVGIAAGWLVVSLARPHIYAGTVLASSSQAPPMTGLVYDDGAPVDLEALHGDVVLVYFGYTHCPDLCPAMLSTIARAVDAIGSGRERVTTMMVTVDPQRDTPELLGAYVAHFDGSFRGVWGTAEQVRSIATQYGVYFENGETDDAGNYLVGHTATLMLIDPDGALRIVYPVELGSGDLADDLAEMTG